MRSARTIGIDLPLKALVWRDDEGQTWFTYNEPVWLAKRHGEAVAACPQLSTMTDVLAAPDEGPRSPMRWSIGIAEPSFRARLTIVYGAQRRAQRRRLAVGLRRVSRQAGASVDRVAGLWPGSASCGRRRRSGQAVWYSQEPNRPSRSQRRLRLTASSPTWSPFKDQRRVRGQANRGLRRPVSVQFGSAILVRAFPWRGTRRWRSRARRRSGRFPPGL